MIIDETNYSLKGKQVKDVADRIKENAGDIAELETALGGKQDALTTEQLAAVNSGITSSDVTKLAGVAAGAEVNVQSDWDESNADSDAYILNKPTLPTVNNATLTVQKNGTSVGTFTANSATDTTINITVPVTAADVSALPASTKYAANLSLTIDSSTYVVTGQLKDQDGNNLGSAQTIDLPLESMVVSGSYDSTNKKIILTLQSGQTIDIPVGDLVSGLQTEITSNNKLSADLVDDSTTTNKFVTASDKTTWSGKQNALTAGANVTITGDTISATDTTYSDFSGATSSAAGTHGLVPAPASGETDKYLKSDGSWATVSQYSLPAATASTLGGVKIGTNLSMDANDVLSATDTTYSAFIGTDGTSAGTAGLVPAPATTDAGKFLKADGTWDSAGSSVNVVQTTGTSTTDVMSQNAVTGMIHYSPATSTTDVCIGDSASAGSNTVAVGRLSSTSAAWYGGTAVGFDAHAIGKEQTTIGAFAGRDTNTGNAIRSDYSTLVGAGARTNGNLAGAVAVGAYSQATSAGEFNIGSTSTSYGYNSSNYRLLTGLYAPQSDHDAATKGYVDTAVASAGASSFTTNEWNALWS